MDQMTSPHTALVSDDLTGALDSAVAFAREGCRTLVATGPAALERALATGADVIAVSLNSREAGPTEAAARARQAAHLLSGVPVLFKKIDSRMKGHVVEEALALAQARAIGRLILCPAIPELGRKVVDGHVTGHGIASPIPVALPHTREVALACPDAGTDNDLDRIVADSEGALLVGARGLASALARRRGRMIGATVPAPPSLRLPVGLVVGSRDRTTLSQVDLLRAAFPSADWIAAPDGEVGNMPALSEVAILQAIDGSGGRDGATVSERLAKGLVRHLSGGRRTLLLTGGETAAACLNAMGIDVLRLVGEVQPGLPVSEPLDFPDALRIVTKSGGFGDPDCLANLVRVAMDQSRAA
jgi:uncharacterized protein YgbK (DUF1537 family)